MFSLQRELNNKTNGDIWLNGVTKDGREICWHRCIYMEALEAIDSFNWKHWKDINNDPDWENLVVELIDLWHMIMSELIRLKDESYANKYLNTETLGDFNTEALVENLENLHIMREYAGTAAIRGASRAWPGSPVKATSFHFIEATRTHAAKGFREQKV